MLETTCDQMINHFLASQPDPMETKDWGPFEKAVRLGYRDPGLISQLLGATRMGAESFVKTCLDSGFKPVGRFGGEVYLNLLTTAAYAGQTKIIKLFMEAGADSNEPSHFGGASTLEMAEYEKENDPWSDEVMAALGMEGYEALDSTNSQESGGGETDPENAKILTAEIAQKIFEDWHINREEYQPGITYSSSMDEDDETIPDPCGPFADPSGTITNSLGIKLVPIQPGEFQMGSPEDCVIANTEEEFQHLVRITRPYWMGMHQVTQSQYETVTGQNPSHYKGSNLPVEHLSWKEAKAFCDLLSLCPEEAQAGRRYRLPSEAEWEYACRAGTKTPFYTGDTLESDQARFSSISRSSPKPTTPVGTYPPNPWGLFDMHGNVWEWTNDWFSADYYQESPVDDPKGPKTGTHHTLRGGSASVMEHECHSAIRGEASEDCPGTNPGNRFAFIGDLGLRVVCEIVDPSMTGQPGMRDHSANSRTPQGLQEIGRQFKGKVGDVVIGVMNHVNEENAKEVLGTPLVPLIGCGSLKSIVTLALYADVLRMLREIALADKELGDAEIHESLGWLKVIAGTFAKVRKEYSKFAELNAELARSFMRQYESDSGWFGYKNSGTKWSGIVVCRNLKNQFAVSGPLETFGGLLVQWAEQLAGVDGVSRGEREIIDALRKIARL